MTWPRMGVAAMLQDIRAYAPWAAEMEAAGFDLLGYGDTQNLLPESHVALTAMALATSRVRFAPTVSNPVTRHPAVAASAFVALQQLSGGRAVFAIGTGDSAVRNIGERPARVAEIEAWCRAFADLVAGRRAHWREREFQLEFETDPLPLWIAADGPRMLELAGRIADGVMLGSGISDEVVGDNLARLRVGAESSGRNLADLEVWCLTRAHFAASESEGWEDVAYTLASQAHHAFRFHFEGKRVPKEHEAGLRRLLTGYRSDQHNLAAHGAHNSALVTENGLSEFLGRRFLLAGAPEEIAVRIQHLAALGVDGLLLAGTLPDPLAYTRRLGRELLTLRA